MITSVTFRCNACGRMNEIFAVDVAVASKKLVDDEHWIVRWDLVGSAHYCSSCRVEKEAAEEEHRLLLRAAKGG